MAGLEKMVVAAIHDLDLAARYADRLALRADRELRACGPLDAVLALDRLEWVFGTSVAVDRNPVTDSASVTALGEGEEPSR